MQEHCPITSVADRQARAFVFVRGALRLPSLAALPRLAVVALDRREHVVDRAHVIRPDAGFGSRLEFLEWASSLAAGVPPNERVNINAERPSQATERLGCSCVKSLSVAKPWNGNARS